VLSFVTTASSSSSSSSSSSNVWLSSIASIYENQDHSASSDSAAATATAKIKAKPWTLPVFPPGGLPHASDVPGYNRTADTEKRIPRHLWIALRNSSDELNWQMPKLFERNPRWKVRSRRTELH
jgi:hypothetical protein